MQLNSVMFYKTKLTLTRTDPEHDLLWKTVLHIRHWQTDKWNREREILPVEMGEWSRLKTGGEIRSEGRRVYINAEYLRTDKDMENWACRISENITPTPGCADRQWITEIGFEQKSENSAEFSCVVSYCDRAGFIGPYMTPPAASVPRLIRQIIEDPTMCVSVGMDVLPKDACQLQVGDWPHFREKILSPSRELPYIYISPRADGSLLIDPDKLTYQVYGNALVFYASDPAVSAEMKYMDYEYACYDGAIRAYAPHATDPARHRYLNADDVVRYGEAEVLDFFRRAFSANINFYDSFFTLEDCQKRRHMQGVNRRIAEMRSLHAEEIRNSAEEISQAERECHSLKTRLKSVEDAFELAAEEEAKRAMIEEDCRNLQTRIKELEEDYYTAQMQLESCLDTVKEVSKLREAAKLRDHLQKLPQTVEDVVEYFRMTFPERIAFTPRCERSLKECILPPEQLWSFLYALATTMWELTFQQEGDPFQKFQELTGIEAKRTEGMMTRNSKKLMRQFRDHLNGEAIDIEPHITVGKLKQSVHFGVSAKQKLIVVGHCGKHLEIYSSQKQR